MLVCLTVQREDKTYTGTHGLTEFLDRKVADLIYFSSTCTATETETASIATELRRQGRGADGECKCRGAACTGE